MLAMHSNFYTHDQTKAYATLPVAQYTVPPLPPPSLKTAHLDLRNGSLKMIRYENFRPHSPAHFRCPGFVVKIKRFNQLE